jgi:excinuclease ABC subunit C
MENEKLTHILADLPDAPGVYLMKDRSGRILYIGKAKSLKNRVRSYFVEHTGDMRFIARNTRRLADDIEIIITGSEKEALLLENSLIKAHSPRFNIKLRDDKTYPSLRLDPKAPWPTLEIVRRPKKDGALYFGPYPSASAARQTLKIVQKGFKIRSCRDGYMRNRSRPCIQYQMHRCLAPCVLHVEKSEYDEQVKYVRLFLQGRKEDLVVELKDRMLAAAKELEYERAAIFRNQIAAVEATLAPQHILVSDKIDQDLVGMHRLGDEVQIALLRVRGGRLTEQVDGFYFCDQEFPDEELLSSFLAQRYLSERETFIPREIILSRSIQDADALGELLTEKRGGKVDIISPKRGARAAQADTADRNAKQLFSARLHDEDRTAKRLAAIQSRLRLPRAPHRIECVDISHLGGTGTVGAFSVVTNGEIARNAARVFRVKTVDGGNDFDAMKEVLTRRFLRAGRREDGWEAPDLLVVDGGRGQLAVAEAVLRELGLETQPVAALAKAREEEGDAAFDRVFLPNQKNPIRVKTGLSGLHILALARDEAHRLAVSFQRRVRKRDNFTSDLDRIPGVGPKTRRLLLKKFGSIKRIREASAEDLAKVPGIGPASAARIKDGLSL